MIEKVLYRIKLKDNEKVRCCKHLKSLTGKVFIAELTPGGAYVFNRSVYSIGRPMTEAFQVSADMVDVKFSALVMM